MTQLLTKAVDISPEAVERLVSSLACMTMTHPHFGAPGPAAATLRALRAALTASEKDAVRWRHARNYVSIADTDEWQAMERSGHKPDEQQNEAADFGCDRAILAKETTK